MKRLFLTICLTGLLSLVQAQISTNKYWVQFTDKADSPYSIDNPEAYLSQRALDRRARQGIAIDEYDIPVNPQYLEAVYNCGALILNPSKWLNGTTIMTNNQTTLSSIRALPFVAEVRDCPNDPKAQELKQKWMEQEMKTIENTDAAPRNFWGYAYTQINQVNGTFLHDSGYHGEGMVIAVLDGGFIGADTHPCFDLMREEGRLLGVRDFVDPHGSVYSQSRHGCNCLGLMAGYDPNTYIGSAYKASFYLIHTEDGDQENIIEEYNWVSGAEYADSLGVDVCSTSLGYIDFDMSQWNHPFSHFDGHTAPMSIGANIAASRGMVCLNSAGNEGDSWSGECTLGIPADAEDILSIGAVDANGQRAYFSSVGPTYDGRIKPDVMAMGQNTYVTDSYGNYSQGSGTSYSCPLLAGVVTCFWQAFPDATAAEIRDAVRACGSRADNPDNKFGYGIPNFELGFNMLPVNEDINPSDNLISVYPNPTSGNVHFVMNSGYQAEISIYDFMGRQLYTYHFNGLNHTTLEDFVNRLSSGLYIVTARSEYGSQSVKVIVD